MKGKEALHAYSRLELLQYLLTKLLLLYDY